MKKIFMMIVAAMAMTMVSCDGTASNGGNDSTATDSAATEQAQEEAAPTSFDKQSFTVSAVPEGWKLENESDDNVRLTRVDGEGTLQVNGGFMTMDKKIEYYSGPESAYEKRDDVTVNDITWKVFEGKSNGLIYLFTEKLGGGDKGTVEVMTFREPVDGASLKALLESITLK